MGDHHHGGVVLGQLLHNLENLAHHFRIQCGGRLVEQQHVWIHREGAGDGDPLLLPAGQAARVFHRLVRQPDLVQQLHRELIRFVLGHLFELGRGQGDVAHHGHVWKQVELLKHHPHLLPQLIDLAQVLHHRDPLDDDIPLRRDLEEVDAAQEGGFAAAGRADHADTLALVHMGVDPLEDLEFPEILVEILYVNHFYASAFPEYSARWRAR